MVRVFQKETFVSHVSGLKYWDKEFVLSATRSLWRLLGHRGGSVG